MIIVSKLILDVFIELSWNDFINKFKNPEPTEDDVRPIFSTPRMYGISPPHLLHIFPEVEQQNKGDLIFILLPINLEIVSDSNNSNLLPLR